jgi:hypothetical protein
MNTNTPELIDPHSVIPSSEHLISAIQALESTIREGLEKICEAVNQSYEAQAFAAIYTSGNPNFTLKGRLAELLGYEEWEF